ncbi:MAG: DUF554 domain-containing protein [Clostridia bacterium]|nr:DUF554 domain-containing protein [Clostridia bacterium]
MLGVLVNTASIIVCSLLGLLLKKVITEKIETVVMQALGICVFLIGVSDAVSNLSSTTQFLVLIVSFALGALIGTLLNIENLFNKAGGVLEKLINKNGNPSTDFKEGFVQATMIFCIGAMVIYGSLSAGLGDNKTLLIKAVLDGTVALLLTVKYGIGVIFSAIPVLVIQGAIALLSGLVGDYLMAQTLFKQELTAIGGVFVMMIGINLLGIKKMHVANMLPAILGACYFLIF